MLGAEENREWIREKGRRDGKNGQYLYLKNKNMNEGEAAGKER